MWGLTSSEHRLPVSFEDKPIGIPRSNAVFPVLSRIDHANPKEADNKGKLFLYVSISYSKDKRIDVTYHKSNPKGYTPYASSSLLAIASENNKRYNASRDKALRPCVSTSFVL